MRDAKEWDQEFRIAGDISRISPADVARQLADYLEVLNLDPKCEDAYVGACNDYLILGAPARAKELRTSAVRNGINPKLLDSILQAFGEG